MFQFEQLMRRISVLEFCKQFAGAVARKFRSVILHILDDGGVKRSKDKTPPRELDCADQPPEMIYVTLKTALPAYLNVSTRRRESNTFPPDYDVEKGMDLENNKLEKF